MRSFEGEIPYNNKNFQRIIDFYLFNCPVRVFNRVNKFKEDSSEGIDQQHPKYNYHFRRVSHRGLSFADKGIEGPKLNSFRAAMKRVAETDILLLAVDDVPTLTSNQEYIIIKKNPNNVSNTEGFFYCIRNAFAHGSFEISNKRDYSFVNSTDEKIRGIAKVKEKTLLKWIELFNMEIDDIKNAGR